MKATILTPAQMKQEEKREYNPSSWNANIERMLKYENVTFYKVQKGNGFDYDRYYVSYTLPEGLKLFSYFDYSSSITNGGFQEAIILTSSYSIKDGVLDIVDFEEGVVEIKGRTYDGKWLNNSKEAREWMIKRSEDLGCYFTKEGI